MLDDANVEIRRKAAAVLYALHGKGVVPELARSLSRDEDAQVRRWVALALVRAGEVPSLQAEGQLRSLDFEERKFAALAYAERGDKRAIADLAAWWAKIAQHREALVELTVAREIILSLGKLQARAAVPDLLLTLREDGGNELRLRPLVADCLGEIGDGSAVEGLLATLEHEPQASTRLHEARALAALGAKQTLAHALAPYAAGSDPMLEAVTILRQANALDPKDGGWMVAQPTELHASLHVGQGSGKVVVLVEQDTPTAITLEGTVLSPRARSGSVSLFELDVPGSEVQVASHGPCLAVWAVRQAAGSR